ncbi:MULTISPECIES: hypothetical protein [Vibrio]|uniref:hypothetical protein n=1 Tax=Vibrio TaxID=662 RepID=UPI002075E4EA|nr:MULTISPECIES: hypothetical protein [Vibrio]USD31538.1 hypothetical protein J8Z27_09640 [Vibrio sp. SCSIO 43186]USD44582.1 hypothetical protein J4N38_10025 [Vibrio sp. SCSIO 43145]USD68661.1 hypothetical protein J4N41_09640 [Vibrio sp. SCSIO 43139]USD96351.1 hypothetical protein CTT30_09770 [Vibrio coralliilyticus]
MKEQYVILTKQRLDNFPFQQTPMPIVPVEPDLLLEMTFSPKLFIISDIASKVEQLVQHGVDWLDARVDCSPSQPSDDQIKVYEDYRMPYIHQTYRLTDKEKQYGKLNWLDVNSTDFDFSRLEHIPLEERLIFKLEEDFGLIFIHQSVIDLLKKHVKDVWVRDV